MTAFRLTCREVTRLVLEGEARELSLAERTVLRLHWMAERAEVQPSGAP
jgi:hypothetical protein